MKVVLVILNPNDSSCSAEVLVTKFCSGTSSNGGESEGGLSVRYDMQPMFVFFSLPIIFRSGQNMMDLAVKY